MYTNTHLVKHFLTHGKTRNGNVEMKEICCSPSASIFSWQMDFPVSSTQSLETILDNVIITGLKHEILGEFTLIGIDTNSNQTLQLKDNFTNYHQKTKNFYIDKKLRISDEEICFCFDRHTMKRYQFLNCHW